jgi:cytochrome P450
LNDPYPELKRLREDAPVFWVTEQKYWLVSRYDDVQEVLKDNSFGKQIHTWKHGRRPLLAIFFPQLLFLRKMIASWLLNLNPPDHTRVRTLLAKAFTPSSIQALMPQIDRLADTLLEDLSKKATSSEPIDLISEFAYPFPLAVIGLILGIPMDHSDKLRGWSQQVVGLIGGNRDVKKLLTAGSAMQQFAAYLKPHIEARRKNPTADLLSVLVQAEDGVQKLKTEELVASSILLLVAGFETTVNLIANCVICLDRFPQQANLVKENPELAKAFVAETLRFESPAQIAPRLAGSNTTVRGAAIKEGDMVWLLLGSANRDAQQFKNADTFEIERTEARNIAFGDGIHRCIGAGLAEAEAGIAINALLKRFPELKVAEPVQFQSPFGLRGPRKLLMILKNG